MSSTNNSNNRQLIGLTARGYVTEITKGKAVVNIGTEDNPVLTPLISWCVLAAGEVNSQRVPSIGESVILLNSGNGDDLGGMVIIGYLHCDLYPAPDVIPQQLTIDTKGVKSVLTVAGAYTVIANVITKTADAGTYNIKSFSVIADVITQTAKSFAVDAATITLTGAITLAGAVTATAKMIIASALSVAGLDFKSHKHLENNKDGGDTGGAK